MSPKTKVVIVGSGEYLNQISDFKQLPDYSTFTTGIFGTSTGLWLLKKDNYDVTILDKSEVLPAPDAASTGELADLATVTHILS